MKRATILLAFGLLSVSLFASPATLAQENGDGEDPSGVQEALEELQDSTPTGRAEARSELVNLGNDAVQPLIEEVQAYEPGEDDNYTAHCVVALGELGDTAATNALLSALEIENKQVSYQAARALGKIHSGGSEGQMQEVNAALAATVFRHHPRPLSLGASIALARINGIVENPTEMQLNELYPAITEWVASGPDGLPPLEDQEWPLLLQVFVKGENSSQRQRAQDLLVGTKPLPAVDTIIELLQGDRAELSDTRWNAVAELAGSITGVSFPSDGSRSDRLAQWRMKWHRDLRTRTGEKFRRYCWRALDENIGAFKRNPTDETKERVNTYKEILLTQTDDPDQIPDWVSDAARDLLEEPIKMKNQVKGAMGDIEADTPAYQKIAELAQVSSVAQKESGKPVVRMFAERLITMARQEENDDVLAMLSNILTQISGIPCDLSQEGALDEWLQMARERYPDAMSGI